MEDLKANILERLQQTADADPTSAIPKDLVAAEVTGFLEDIAPEEYLQRAHASDIANLITILYAIRPVARMSSTSQDADTLQIVLELPPPNHTLFVFADAEPVRARTFSRLEKLSADDASTPYMPVLSAYRSKSTLLKGGKIHIFFGTIAWHPRPSGTPPPSPSASAPSSSLLPPGVAESPALVGLPDVSKERVLEVVTKWRNPCQPAIVSFDPATGGNAAAAGSPVAPAAGGVHEIAFAFDTDSTQRYLQHLVAMFTDRGGEIVRLHMLRIAAGVDVLLVQFTRSDGARTERRLVSRGLCNSEAEMCRQVMAEATLLRLVPFRKFVDTSYTTQSPQVLMYVHATRVFAYYFGSPRVGELDQLAQKMSGDASAVAALTKLQGKFIMGFGDDLVKAILERYQPQVVACYDDFRKRLAAAAEATQGDALSVAALSTDGVERKLGVPTESLLNELKDAARDETDWLVLRSLLVFNAAILRTNFYKTRKAALAFRLDPSFPSAQYPIAKVPYGMYMVLGSHFRGFHIRFSEVARGGIRFIRAPTAAAHERAKRHLFEENLNLAYTQQLKNKDIPEGGAKGTILSRWDSSAAPRDIFLRYIDALLDLMLPKSEGGGALSGTVTPPGAPGGVAEGPQVVDLMPDKEELLFLGPDEGTAGFMTPAAQHARSRGYRFWKAFTTGKTATLGGIPHDVYGMTTAGVRVFVQKTIELLKMKEEETTKVQIGGPDGDLGSNEILTSNDITVAIVDGSGVIYDPEGLDRPEMVRLAKARVMIKEFDVSKLSKGGYRVLCTDTHTTLPGGFVVRNGFQFRNMFHLNPTISADILVPCGGRPGAVDSDTVQRLLPQGGRPAKYKAIVEGANLFVTEDARILLEKAGVVCFKDASVNKGGVTSSSLEVLAALAMPNEDHDAHMCVGADGKTSKLYDLYVKDILEIIRRNAADEFHALERLYLSKNEEVPRPTLTNELSSKINSMNGEVKKHLPSLLERAPEALTNILRKFVPKSLVDAVGMEAIQRNVPLSYQHAIFAAYVASQYVYSHAADSSEFTFFAFLNGMLNL